MSRRRRPPVPVTLVLPAEPPGPEEIDAVLMAADAVIDRAGRAGVTLILKGSRSKKALEWEWDRLPEYGALSHLTADQVARKIDWCIHKGWLRIEHNRDGIPLLYHTEKGWERVKQLWVKRLLGWFEEWRAEDRPEQVWPRLEHIHRDIKFLLLEAIEEQRRHDLAPVLRAWFPHEIRAVRQAINHTLQALGLATLEHPKKTAGESPP